MAMRITPYIVVEDAERAVAFYRDAFGAEEVSRIPVPDWRLMSVQLRIGGGLLHLANEFPEMGVPARPRSAARRWSWPSTGIAKQRGVSRREDKPARKQPPRRLTQAQQVTGKTVVLTNAGSGRRRVSLRTWRPGSEPHS